TTATRCASATSGFASLSNRKASCRKNGSKKKEAVLSPDNHLSHSYQCRTAILVIAIVGPLDLSAISHYLVRNWDHRLCRPMANPAQEIGLVSTEIRQTWALQRNRIGMPNPTLLLQPLCLVFVMQLRCKNDWTLSQIAFFVVDSFLMRVSL